MAWGFACSAALDHELRDALLSDRQQDDEVQVPGAAHDADLHRRSSQRMSVKLASKERPRRSSVSKASRQSVQAVSLRLVNINFDDPATFEPERLAARLYEPPTLGGQLALSPNVILAELRIIVLASIPLESTRLHAMLLQRPHNLEKLDVSYCQLTSTSWPSIWASLQNLSVVWLHGNVLGRWEDVQAVAAAPILQWLTTFGNPIASQPEYRNVVIAEAPQILALDHWVVTDDERCRCLSPVTRAPRAAWMIHQRNANHSCKSKFVSGSDLSVLSLRLKPRIGCIELLQDAKDELLSLRKKSQSCSAASYIQATWGGYLSRQQGERRRAFENEVASRIQKLYRAWRWRQDMIGYTKNYLKEIDELDLLLSTQDRIRQRARKLIESHLRAWVRRRKERKQIRDAGILLTRCARGYLVRINLTRELLCLRRCPKIFFPEECAWEFHVVLNIARRQCHLEPLAGQNNSTFEDADMMAVRMPGTGDIPGRHAVLTAMLSLRNASIIRNCTSGRFPMHLWDGPFHRLAQGTFAPESVHRARALIRRRASNVDNRCRLSFKYSCASGKHPIHRPDMDNLRPPEKRFSEIRSHFVSDFLKAGEARWAAELESLSITRRSAHLLNDFLHEAVALGPRLLMGTRCSGRTMDSGHGAEQREAISGNVYSRAVWLSQRLLSYKCESAKLAHCLICLLVHFRGTGGHAPIIKPVPFLPERFIQEACAVTTIQAHWRAHHARCRLPCSLVGAAVLRRAVLCMQRCWRWSLLRRRFQLLKGIPKAYQSVNTSCLYIEERLFLALNLINSIDRYAPLLPERSLGFGVSTLNHCNTVLIRGDLLGGLGLSVAQDKNPKVRNYAVAQMRKRGYGLPGWLWASLGDLLATGPDENSLRYVSGLQGLLIEGLNFEPNDNNVVTVTHSAIRETSTLFENSSNTSSSPGETLRFVELRFPSLAIAKLRAAALYMCTWSSRHRLAVPLLPKTMLYNSTVCENILKLWDVYDLNWQQGDRVAVSLLRQRSQRYVSDIIPACGREPWSSAKRSEWLLAVDRRVVNMFQKSSSDAANNRMSERGSGILPPVRNSRVSVFAPNDVAASVALAKRGSIAMTTMTSEGEKVRRQLGSIFCKPPMPNDSEVHVRTTPSPSIQLEKTPIRSSKLVAFNLPPEQTATDDETKRPDSRVSTRSGSSMPDSSRSGSSRPGSRASMPAGSNSTKPNERPKKATSFSFRRATIRVSSGNSDLLFVKSKSVPR